MNTTYIAEWNGRSGWQFSYGEDNVDLCPFDPEIVAH